MTLGKYHEETQFRNTKFLLINDSTGRGLASGETCEDFTNRVLPLYGRFHLEYVSLDSNGVVTYHINAGLTAEEALLDLLRLDKGKLVEYVEIRNESRTILYSTDISYKFNLGKYKSYRVKSRRIYLKKAIITVYNEQLVKV